jgi:hypothetical protein
MKGNRQFDDTEIRSHVPPVAGQPNDQLLSDFCCEFLQLVLRQFFYLIG